MKTSIHVLAVCWVSLFVEVSVAQIEYVSSLKAAVTLAEDINKGDFITVVKDVTQIASPFFKFFPSVVNLVLGSGSASTQSAELEYLHKLSDNINQKFDQVNSQFSEVKKLIHWTAVQASYAQFEANIHAVSDHFKRIFEVPIPIRNQQKQLFITSYNSGYVESGSKLFAGFMLENGVFSQGILQPAMTYTENNRGQMRTFMLGILKLLMMAAKVELGYQIIQGYQTTAYYSELWKNRTEQVQAKMIAVDLEVKQKYLDQVKKDISRFSGIHFRFSNHVFSRFLYRELSTKYFWRDWLVVVSTHTEGTNAAHSHVCNGTIISTNGKDIVVDSVEKNRTSFDFHHVQGTCASLQQTCQNTLRYNPCYNNYGRHRRCGEYTTENAGPFFNRITDIRTSCSPYSSYGVINTLKHPVYYAGPTDLSSDRLFVCDLDACNYFVHFFG